MKNIFVLLWILFVISKVDAACSVTNGNDYIADATLDDYEDSGYGYTVVMPEAKITCTCGIITQWIFYSRKNGTLIFYALNGNTIVGHTKVHVPQFVGGGGDNHFVLPLSQPMWIPVQSNYRLAFYSENEFQITYSNSSASGHTSYGYNNVSSSGLVNGGSLQANSGDTSRYNRRYAVAAVVEEAHAPMFVNAPYETTIFTHDFGKAFFTASVLDIDGGDNLTISMAAQTGFTFAFDSTAVTGTITYSSRSPKPKEVNITLTVQDGCPDSAHTVTATVTVNIINARPKFVDLPKSTTVSEDLSTLSIPFSTRDDSGDTVTCVLNPAVSNFILTNGATTNSVTSHTVTASVAFDWSNEWFYELTVDCTDGVNTMTSNIQVDVIANKPPYFAKSNPGFVPALYEVDRDDMKTVFFKISMTDTDGANLRVRSPAPAIICNTGLDSVLTSVPPSANSCPFSITSATGEISSNETLGKIAYDLEIQIRDDDTPMTTPYYLSVVASKGPYRFNESPKIVNLPATIKIMEMTPPDTYLFKLLFTDENPADTFTVTDTIASGALNGYIKFNTTSYVLTTGSKPIDFETSTAGQFEIIVNDGTGTDQYFTVTGTITIQYGDVNEDGINLELNSVAPAEFNESTTPGSVIYTSVVNKAASNATGIDTGEVVDYWMNCGKDSKYFSFDPVANTVKLVREYDMDKGLSGTATCNITARDTGGFTHTKSFNFTVKKRNDIAPQFSHKNYVFFQRPTDTFFTLIANMSASDADVVDTPTVLTYKFGPDSTKASTESHFQIDEDGILYIRNVTTVPDGSYKTFEIIVSDNDAQPLALSGTCTVTVIFSGVALTTTTTTERNYVFLDEYENYWWMFLVGVGLFAAVVFVIFIVCNDPRIYDYVVHQMNRFAHWCRRKPKPKVPRRTVGKLTVTVNKKRLENDPDNALPWELLAKDGDVPELNQVQADIQKRKEKRDRDYKNFKGLPIFEKGKGTRPDSAQSTSSTSSDVTRTSDSPKYATFVSKEEDLHEGGEDQWGDLEGATGGK